MKRTLLTMSLATALMPLALGQPAFAHESDTHAQQQRYSGSVTYTECRKSPGTTGLAVGGVAGALVGGGLIGGGLLGPLIGAVGGAFAGRAIDRESTKAKRCKVVREDEPRQQQELAPADSYQSNYYQDDLYADGPSVR
jgi:outer membrane lipoprotein SlyB